MDPYERAQLESEGLQQAESAIKRLRDKAMHLRRIVVGPSFPLEVTEDLTIVSQTKSSPFAELKRRHPDMSLPECIGLAVAAICLGGLVTWFVRKRSS